MMPRKSGTKVNIKAEHAPDGSHLVGNSTSVGTVGPARGGTTSTRGSKRRRTLGNNLGSGITGNYGSGTIVAANPFDDDHHVLPSNANLVTTNKMIMVPNHHPHQQPMTPHHPHQQPPHHYHPHQQPPPPPPTQQHPHHMQQHTPPLHHPHHHHHPHPQQPQHHQPQQQMHPNAAYPPIDYAQQPMPPHPHSQMATPPGPMVAGGPIPPTHQMQDHHLGGPPPLNHHHPPPQHIQQQQQPPPPPPPSHHIQQSPGTMHNHGSHMMTGAGIPAQQNYGHPPPPPPSMHHQQAPPLQQQPQGAPQTQMIGTSTPPHMIGPSQSPYMQQQPQQPMLVQQPPPPHPNQSMTPQPSPHHDQMMMQQQHQQQPYGTMNQNIYCAKCQREIYQNDPNMICKAGCRSYFHLACSGLTQLACEYLMKESLAEWACDRCTSGNRRVPFVKYKS